MIKLILNYEMSYLNTCLHFISGNNWRYIGLRTSFMEKPKKRIWRFTKEKSAGIHKRMETI